MKSSTLSNAVLELKEALRFRQLGGFVCGELHPRGQRSLGGRIDNHGSCHRDASIPLREQHRQVIAAPDANQVIPTGDREQDNLQLTIRHGQTQLVLSTVDSSLFGCVSLNGNVM